jgi:hypothetical protein
MRHTFEGVRVTGTFMLKSVIVKKTPSMAFSFDYVKDLNRKKTCFFNSLNQTLLQVPSPKIFCSTVNSRFKKDPKLQIYLPKAFISDNRFLDSLYKSFLDQTTLDLSKEKWIFLNREFTVID